MNTVKKDTEDSTLATRSEVHFNIINGVNCKYIVTYKLYKSNNTIYQFLKEYSIIKTQQL